MTDKYLIAKKFKELPDFVELENSAFWVFTSSTGSYHALVEGKGYIASPCPCGETYTEADRLMIPAEELLNSSALWGDCIFAAKPRVSTLGFFDTFSDYLLLFEAAETLKDLSLWEEMDFTQLLGLIRALIVLGEFQFPYLPIGEINVPSPRVLKIPGMPPEAQFKNIWDVGPVLVNRLLMEFPAQAASFAVGENVSLEDLKAPLMVFISESTRTIWRESSRLMNPLPTRHSDQSVSDGSANDKLKRIEDLVRLQLLIILSSTKTFKVDSFTFFCSPAAVVKGLFSFNFHPVESCTLPQGLDAGELEFFSRFVDLYFTDEKASTLSALSTFTAASALKLGVIEPAWSSYQTAVAS